MNHKEKKFMLHKTIDLSTLKKTLLKKENRISSVFEPRYSALSSKRSAFIPSVDSVLNGPRRKRYPLIALNTQRSMGTARHILSQRVIAGSLVINPPYKP